MADGRASEYDSVKAMDAFELLELYELKKENGTGKA